MPLWWPFRNEASSGKTERPKIKFIFQWSALKSLCKSILNLPTSLSGPEKITIQSRDRCYRRIPNIPFVLILEHRAPNKFHPIFCFWGLWQNRLYQPKIHINQSYASRYTCSFKIRICGKPSHNMHTYMHISTFKHVCKAEYMMYLQCTIGAYIYIYICMHVCIHIRIHMYTRKCICIYRHICILYIIICVNKYINIYNIIEFISYNVNIALPWRLLGT